MLLVLVLVLLLLLLLDELTTIHYLSRSKIVNTEVRELSRVARGKVRPGDTDDWKNEQLLVPPLPPSNLRGCHLIKIQYDVYFTIRPDNLEKEIKLQLPVTIASYPYRNADGTLKRKRGAHYPTTLPMQRPWLDKSKPAA
ncbi:arrestin domain-containing protein 4-like [Pollicipes pollicipes]|uniref:arrestin domain-containing protein 4-like n=1 Tax=Pollicipes pollicipes TaxID=41117 RepID=UPI0018859D12|nr:arrestin domain-containing protein 4-like [Pollicipes pollicipes]